VEEKRGERVWVKCDECRVSTLVEKGCRGSVSKRVKLEMRVDVWEGRMVPRKPEGLKFGFALPTPLRSSVAA